MKFNILLRKVLTICITRNQLPILQKVLPILPNANTNYNLAILTTLSASYPQWDGKISIPAKNGDAVRLGNK